jgi:hypothetical protein
LFLCFLFPSAGALKIDNPVTSISGYAGGDCDASVRQGHQWRFRVTHLLGEYAMGWCQQVA